MKKNEPISIPLSQSPILKWQCDLTHAVFGIIEFQKYFIEYLYLMCKTENIPGASATRYVNLRQAGDKNQFSIFKLQITPHASCPPPKTPHASSPGRHVERSHQKPFNRPRTYRLRTDVICWHQRRGSPRSALKSQKVPDEKSVNL